VVGQSRLHLRQDTGSTPGARRGIDDEQQPA